MIKAMDEWDALRTGLHEEEAIGLKLEGQFSHEYFQRQARMVASDARDYYRTFLENRTHNSGPSDLLTLVEMTIRTRRRGLEDALEKFGPNVIPMGG